MIITNKAQCRQCKDIIESKHRHDFVVCKCGGIFIDGGNAYVRQGTMKAGFSLDDIIDLSEYGEE